MTILPFPEWLPDQPDYGPVGGTIVRNCVPLTAKSYGPMPTPQPWSTNALGARCQGAYSIKDSDGGVHIIAGDATKLYRLFPSAETFTDMSGATYTTPAPSAGGFWSMTAFGKRIIASNYSDPIQTVLLDDLTAFADLSADAPKAKFVTTVKDFLFAANTFDPVDGAVPYRVWWSALGNPTLWPTPGSVTAQQLQSDYQDLQQTDLGNITGMAAGFPSSLDVAIFCERGIWAAAYAGVPTLFSFRVTGAPGTSSPLSIVQSRVRAANGGVLPVAFYLAEDGFQAFDGGSSTPIGAQKFDREFYREASGTWLHYVQGVADPRTKLVFWAFASENSSDGLFDRVLVYNWEIGRAVISELTNPANHGEWLTRGLFANAYNLDELDPFGDLDTIRPSFDDPFWMGAPLGRLSTFTPDHALATWDGPAMAPTIDIPEVQPYPGRRAWVTNARPLIDGGDPVATVQIGRRERLAHPIVWETAVPVNLVGDCPQRATGRYLRFRFAMPAAQTFTHLQGLDVTMAPEGRMR